MGRHGDEQQVKRAEWLFQEFEDNATHVLVPSVVLAEYLVPVDPQSHSDVVAPLANRLIIGAG